MPRYTFQREEILSQREVAGMIAKAKKSWLKALVAFCYIFGPRITEALRLKRRNFSVEGNNLIVNIGVLKRRQAGPFKDMPHLLRADLKTPFIDHLLTWVKKIEKPDDLVWPLARTWAYARWRAWHEIKRLNPNCSPHIFRHTRLTKLALKEASGPDLMDWAGWADMRPAARYLHAGGKLAGKYADKID